jgi:ubiquinone/menaquinone biosynthesis C-methylase UbiE
MSTTQTEIGGVQRSRQEAKATSDRLSHWYDLLAGRSEAKSQNEGLRRLNAAKGEQVLEVGFGTGHGLAALARQVGKSGVDCRPIFVESTRECWVPGNGESRAVDVGVAD